MNKKTIYNIFLMCALILGGASGIASAGDQDAVEAPLVEIGLPGTVFRYEQTFGENGVAYLIDSDHLYAPRGLGLDAADNLWVAEADGARAIKFAPDYSSPMYIGQAGFSYLADETHFARPVDVAVSGDGSVWVVDRGAQRVVKFDADGNFLAQLGVTWEAGSDNAHFDGPVGIALDSDDNIYVSDTENHRIQVFQNNGFYSITIGLTGNPGTGNDQFNHPTMVAIDDSDYLYVADGDNNRVQVFDENLNYFSTISSDAPRGVAVDEDFIYVVEVYNHRVQIYDRATHALVTSLGSYGSGDYGFDTPTDVGVDSSGDIYVLDALNYRVQKYEFDHSSLTFTYQHTYGTTGVPYVTDGYHYNQPTDVAVHSNGNIAIIEDEGRGHRLIVLDASGVPQFTVGEAGVFGGDDEHFNDARGVVFDADGNVYVADCANHRVQIFDDTGMWLARIGWGTGNYQLDCPTGVAVASSGNIYVADSGNQRIQIYDENHIYEDTLGELDVPGSDNDHFRYPQDVDVDLSGNIYVADSSNERVQVFNSDLDYQMTLGITGECGYDFDHFCTPFGVAVDTEGNIYVSEYWNPRVQVFDSGGAYLTTIGGAWGNQSNQFRHLHGVDVDEAGNVYIADTLNHRVQKFASGVPGWEQINVNGFGVLKNRGMASLEVFEGSLYAGTANWEDGGRVWRTADGVTWEPASALGFGAGTPIPTIIDLVEFEGQLYAGTGWGSAPGQVWRSPDGSTWEAVTTDGFDDGSNYAISAFGTFNGWLYAGSGNSNRPQIWRSKSGDGNDWVQVAPDGDVGQGDSGVTAFAVFEGALYAAIEDDEIAQIWRSTDGSQWEAVVADGFENEENCLSGGFAEFGGYLYVGSGNEIDGAELWRSDDGTQWELAKGEGFGDPNNIKVQMVFVFDGWLYVGLDNSYTGMQVWRTDDGTEWEQVNPDGFGDSNNAFTLWSNATTVFECRLTLGTWNDANGGEVWSMLEDDELCVDKRGPDSAYYDQEVTYQMAVTYSSLDGLPAQHLSVEDDVYGAAAYISGDENEDELLDVTETWIYRVYGTIGAPGEVEDDPIMNTVTVSGQDMEGIELPPATDTHTTDVQMQMFLPLALRE